jgi:carboxyl-terminal processing protease
MTVSLPVMKILKNAVLLYSLAIAMTFACARDEFGGLGIEVMSGTEEVVKARPYVIVSVFRGGTGEKAGLKGGDIIRAVEGISLEGLKYDYIVNDLLRGRIGTRVRLKIERNNKIMEFEVQRGKIVVN